MIFTNFEQERPLRFLRPLARRLSRLHPLALTAAALAVSTSVRVLLDPLLASDASSYQFITFYPAILLSTLIAGWRYGVLATLASVAIAVGLFSDLRDPALAAALVLFASANILMIALAASIRQARGRAERASATVLAREEALKRAEAASAHLAAIVQSSNDAIVSKTLDGIVTSWNEGASQLFGFSAAEMIGQPITRILPPALLAEEELILSRVAAGEHVADLETERLAKDGRRIAVSLTVSPVRDRNGEIVGVSKVARNITERKRTQQALREEAQSLETLNGVARKLAAELDLERIVQAATDAATGLSGARFGAFFYNVKNDAGDSYLLYTLSGAPREAFERFGMPRNTQVFAHTFDGRGPVRLDDVTQDSRYGKNAPYRGMPPGHLPVRSYLAVPVISRSGEAIGGLFLGHPEAGVFTARAERLVTGIASQAAVAIDNARLHEQRVQLIEKLRVADRRKDDFLAILAHELRNPLAPVRQAVKIAQNAGATEAQKRWSQNVIDRQVQHMALLLDDLLDVARITQGKLELRRERIELAVVIDTAVEIARPLTDARGQTISVELPREAIHLEADALRLSQVIGNLLTNAAKYSASGTNIRLGAASEGDRAVVRVADTGIGIAPEMLPRVFEMFSQDKSVKERAEGGLGIGLALVKGLVELHGGAVGVRSEGEGRGSEFIVTLPLGKTFVEAAGKRAPATQAAAARRQRVLVADDNADAAESLAMLLDLEGHETRTAFGGEEALALAKEFRPTLAVLDIGMPQMNGYELARRIRAEPWGSAVTLVALTGFGQAEDKQQARAAGFDHHMTKPIEPDAVAKLLSEGGQPASMRPECLLTA